MPKHSAKGRDVSLDSVDPTLTPPKRLAALGMLVNTKEIEFAFIRDHLGLSDSDLSKQMSALVEAGYVGSRKSGKGRTRKTWFRATAQGKRALASHVEALNQLVLDSLPSPGPQVEQAQSS